MKPEHGRAWRVAGYALRGCAHSLAFIPGRQESDRQKLLIPARRRFRLASVRFNMETKKGTPWDVSAARSQSSRGPRVASAFAPPEILLPRGPKRRSPARAAPKGGG